MALTPVEIVPITASATLAVTLISMAVQRWFSRKDADLEAARRREEAELNAQRALALTPRHLALQRDAQVKLELLRVFTEAQVELRQGPSRLLERSHLLAPYLPDIRDHLARSMPEAVRGIDDIDRFIALSRITGAVARREFDNLGIAAGAEIRKESSLYLAQVIDGLERWLLAVCADIVANWHEIETAHGNDCWTQITVAAECALYATRVLGASLRGEPIPSPPRVLAVRLPALDADRALRERRPIGWVAPAELRAIA
jgi:hypothetical protein